MIPNTPETRNFTVQMKNYWKDSLTPFGIEQIPDLEFEFLDNESQLLETYSSDDIEKPMYLAIVFDGDPFVNM